VFFFGLFYGFGIKDGGHFGKLGRNMESKTSDALESTGQRTKRISTSRIIL
jgi:hypothetical protein